MRALLKNIGMKYYYLSQVLKGNKNLLQYGLVELASKAVSCIFSIFLVLMLVSISWMLITISLALVIHYYFDSVLLSMIVALVFSLLLIIMSLLFRKTLILKPMTSLLSDELIGDDNKERNEGVSKIAIAARTKKAIALYKAQPILPQVKEKANVSPKQSNQLMSESLNVLSTIIARNDDERILLNNILTTSLDIYRYTSQN